MEEDYKTIQSLLDEKGYLLTNFFKVNYFHEVTYTLTVRHPTKEVEVRIDSQDFEILLKMAESMLSHL